MNKPILILEKSPNNHSYRLEAGLKSCNQRVIRTSNPSEIKDQVFSLAFIESMGTHDLTGMINADEIIPFDAEDDPNFFEPNLSYYSIKDKCSFYAKLVYRARSPELDGLKLIAFPIINFLNCARFADIPAPSSRDINPFFVGSPAYLNFWKEKPEHIYCKSPQFKPIAYFPSDDSYLYSQRFDWLETMTTNSIPFNGGVVFSKDPASTHSIDFQTKSFGEAVRKYALNQYVNPVDHNLMSLNCSITLAPTGHDRYSWRIFDIMATGSIMMVTDLDDRVMLYNPKAKVTVKDGSDFLSALESTKSEESRLLSLHAENREVFKGKTPELIWRDFLNQMV